LFGEGRIYLNFYLRIIALLAYLYAKCSIERGAYFFVMDVEIFEVVYLAVSGSADGETVYPLCYFLGIIGLEHHPYGLGVEG